MSLETNRTERSADRIRGRKLQQIRKLFFSKSPLCAICLNQGRIKTATELDHIIPLHKGGSNDMSNLQGLCIHCHQAKTADDCGYKERHQIGLDGWPVG